MEKSKNIFPIEEVEAAILKIKNQIPIYPKYNMINRVDDFTVSTLLINSLLRVKREGVYYLVRIKLEYTYSSISQEIINQVREQTINMFHSKAYMTYIAFRVDNDAILIDGTPAHYIDIDQTSEEERLLNNLI